MKKTTKKWLAKVAKINNTTEEKVLKYLASLSVPGRVIHHLNLKG